MNKANSEINLLAEIGGACMNMAFDKAIRPSVDSMTAPKPRKAKGTYGRDLQAKFASMRLSVLQAKATRKELGYANRRG